MPAGEGGGRPGRRPGERSRARDWALQVLYAWEAMGGAEEEEETLERTLALRRVAPGRRGYLRRLVRAVAEHREEIDRRLADALENWRLERLSALDRAILRLAAAEILFLNDIPPKVSIQEAIYLAERYGGPDSPRFVNGVLDALLKGRRGAPR